MCELSAVVSANDRKTGSPGAECAKGEPRLHNAVEHSSAPSSAAEYLMSTPGVLEYCHVRSTPGDRGAPPHSQRCASAAAHLDETQKVDGRGVEVLRLDFRDERLPSSIALDRRELHTSIFSHAAQFLLRRETP
jgi:hypothetical protein